MYQIAHQNDGFNALRLYCSKLNPACNTFFKFPEPEESAWFEKKCLGVNKVGIMMKDLSKAANFSQVYDASGQQL